MCHSRWKLLGTMITMATNIMKTMAKFALIKSVAFWLYEYDTHSVMGNVHLTEIFEHPALALKSQPVLH